MFFKHFYIFLFIKIINCDPGNFYSQNYQYSNTLACPDNKICLPLDFCTEMVASLREATLPVHRFRQAVCGYEGKTTKVCCDSPSDAGNTFSNYKNHPSRSPASKSGQKCGQSFVKSNTPTLGSFPFLARVGFINLSDGSQKYSCTGTIVNERTVLTTATCALASSDDYKLHSALIGEFDSSTNPDCNQLFCAYCTQSYEISYVVKHPNFVPETFEHNIALLRLNQSIPFTLTAQPICYSDHQYVPIGCTAILVGWGKLSHYKESSQQQVLPIKILPTQDCGEFLSQGLGVELCGIGIEDACSGYSGSPLIIADTDGYSVIGMLSYGSQCNSNQPIPSVFMNIQKYATWIAQNS